MVNEQRDRIAEMLGLIAQYPNVSARHIDYAEYVNVLDLVFEQCQAELNIVLVVQFRLLIFDLALINALGALSVSVSTEC